MASELMRYDIVAEIEKYEFSKPSFGGDGGESTQHDNIRTSPKIDVAKVFDEGKNRITNFFRLKTSHPTYYPQSIKNDDDTATTPTTTEDNSLITNNDTTSSTVRTGGDESTPSTTTTDTTKNFFTVTQDKLKNLLKPATTTTTTTVTNSTVNLSNDENDAGVEDHEKPASLPKAEDNGNEIPVPPDSPELSYTSFDAQSSGNVANNDNGEQITGQHSKKSLFSKAGFFKKSKNKKNARKSKDSNNTSGSNKDHKQTNEEDQSDADDDAENEEKEHECPVCFEIPLPPIHIYQCINGHLYCGKCMAMPNMFNCPQCGVDIGSVKMRNRYAEENIQRLYGGKKKK